MATQNGTGTITQKGQNILAYINSIPAPSTPSLVFKRFVLSSKSELVSDIVDDTNTNFNDKQYSDLITYLAGADEYTGSVSAGVVDPSTPNTLPLLLSLPISAIPTDTSIHTIFITAEDPQVPGSEYIFWHGCLYFDDNGTVGNYADDGSTIPFTYIAGTNLLLRVNLQYTSGFPEDLTFVDTQAIEIEAHNQDPTSHNLTHLRIDGNNSPLANISWDSKKITDIAAATNDEDVPQWNQVVSHTATDTINVANMTEFDAAIATLPKIVNNTVNINITADDPSFSGQSLNVDSVGGKGEIIITHNIVPQTNIIKRLTCIDCSAKVYFNDFNVVAGSGFDGAITVNSHVYLNDCKFASSSGSDKAAISATQHAYVECDGVIISGINDRAVFAKEGSTVVCGDMVHENTTDYCNEVAFEAQSGAVIIKPNDFSDVTKIIKTDNNRYSNTIDGGRIYGYFGLGDGHAYDTLSSDNQLIVDIDTTNANYVNHVLKQAGPFIPENCEIIIRYADGSGGQYTGVDGLRINGWNGRGDLKFAPLSGSGGAVQLTHVAASSSDYAIKCENNDINIEFSAWSYTLTTAGDYFIYFKNNTKKIRFFENAYYATAAQEVPVAYFENCLNVEIEDASFWFDIASSNSNDINLRANSSKIKFIDGVQLRNGYTGFYAEKGSEISDFGNTSVSATNFHTYSITGAKIAISSVSYTPITTFAVYTADSGMVLYASNIYLDGTIIS